MNRLHRMPFGAEPTEAGDGFRFRLWAPSAKAVTLCLEHDGVETRLPMVAEGDWFALEVPGARAGANYRYHIDDRALVPDPASRFQPDDVHGASALVDPSEFSWSDDAWRGRQWDDAVLYELHVGTFSPKGDFAGVAGRLDYLVELGVTAVELMPVSDWPGARNWGYDGVYPFAPDRRYGTPEDLKRLVAEAHRRGLMMFLDVVYNHFGPEGNYLYQYAPQFFTDRYKTPWGAAIDFDSPHSRTVRDFFIENVLYWLNEYHFDGLRLDAVHAIYDQSHPDILTGIAAAVETRVDPRRQVHLVLENDDNEARYLERRAGRSRGFYTAQWNDDIHHVLHVLLTGEDGGYYGDYVEAPLMNLGRALTEGFVYQGEASPYRGGTVRGEPSRQLPSVAFVSFLQNHDQIGNRAFGDRITTLAESRAVRAAAALYLLAPSPPMLFMGEEWGCETPFLFFCDFEPGLSPVVREGRRSEFARFPEFRDEAARERIPDPGDPETYRASCLDWSDLDEQDHRDWLDYYRELIALRHREIIPRLNRLLVGEAHFAATGARALTATWESDVGSRLVCLANLAAEPVHDLEIPQRLRWFFHGPGVDMADLEAGRLPGWSVAWAWREQGA